jgi:hypothetical protein
MRSIMKYQTPKLQRVGAASTLIQVKTVPPGDVSNPMYHQVGSLSVLIEA